MQVVPDGSTRRCKIEMYPDSLLIKTTLPAPNQVRVMLAEIAGMNYHDKTKEGLPMGGISLGTTTDNFEFLSIGFLAPINMQKAVWTFKAIERIYRGDHTV